MEGETNCDSRLERPSADRIRAIRFRRWISPQALSWWTNSTGQSQSEIRLWRSHARANRRCHPLGMPVKLPESVELNRFDVVVSKTHVDGSGDGSGVAWNGYSRQATTGKVIAIEEIHRRAIRHQGPGVDPDGIGKK